MALIHEDSSLVNMSSEPTPSLLDRLRAVRDDTFSPRSRKQFMLLAAGSTFFLFAATITRRALIRRQVATIPKFYHQSNLPAPGSPNFNGPMEALQALNLATLNTAAGAMVLVGGTLWAADISSLEEMRKKVRGGLGVDGTGRTEGDVEEEFEEWIAGILERKDDKERRKADAKGRIKDQWANDRGKER